MNCDEVITTLKTQANPDNVAGMARFGISSEGTLGISIPFLRSLAKTIGKDHELALELWESGYHEARILASMIDNPKNVTEQQLEIWVADFDSWDVCDQVCGNLIERTDFAIPKAVEWADREEEFVRRAGFTLMARLAVVSKKTEEEILLSFFPIIFRHADDNRNFVKKAVNWAVRQIGKRNPYLRNKAIDLCHQLLELESPTARWIARDALRELEKYEFKPKSKRKNQY